MQIYPGQMYPLPNSNLLVQSPITPGQMSLKFEMRWTTPVNWTQCYRALIHHVSLACGRMQTHSGQMYPAQLTLMLQSPTTLHIFEPSGIEPYYTRSVWHVTECRCTQVRCTLPPLIEPCSTEHYYTRWVWHEEECRHTQVRSTPPANQT